MSAHVDARTVDTRRGIADAIFPRALMYAAPVAALLAGCAAEWLDFSALRYPLLAMVLVGVTLTRYAHDAAADDGERSRQRGWLDVLLRTVVLGVATWSAAETVYVLLHVVQGERFSADRFGPQPIQALALIAAHGVFLGAPTGVAGWALLRVPPSLRRRRAA